MIWLIVKDSILSVLLFDLNLHQDDAWPFWRIKTIFNPEWSLKVANELDSTLSHPYYSSINMSSLYYIKEQITLKNLFDQFYITFCDECSTKLFINRIAMKRILRFLQRLVQHLVFMILLLCLIRFFFIIP